MSRAFPPLARPVVALFMTLIVACASSAHARNRREKETVYPAREDVQVIVSNPVGEVRIEGWDRNEVLVKQRLGKGVDSLRVSASPERLELKIDAPFHLFARHRKIRSRLELRVPHRARLQVDGVTVQIEAKDIAGAVRMQTISGRIKVEGRPTSARLETVSARIELKGEKTAVDARTISGEIRLEGVGETLEVESTSGRVEVKDSHLRAADIISVSGEVRLETSLDPNARIEIETVSGAIRMEIPDDTDALFTLSSMSGGLEVRAGEERSRKAMRRLGRRLEVGLGKATARVGLSSFSGSIEVRD